MKIVEYIKELLEVCENRRKDGDVTGSYATGYTDALNDMLEFSQDVGFE